MAARKLLPRVRTRKKQNNSRSFTEKYPSVVPGYFLFLDEPARLVFPEFGVDAVLGQERVVRAVFDDAAIVQHDDTVKFGDGRQAVSDND